MEKINELLTEKERLSRKQKELYEVAISHKSKDERERLAEKIIQKYGN